MPAKDLAAFCHFYRMTPREVAELTGDEFIGLLEYANDYARKTAAPSPTGEGASSRSGQTVTYRNPNPRQHSSRKGEPTEH